MDWGICQFADPQGQVHNVSAFAMILGNSRAKYVQFTSRCDLQSLERCILNAMEYYGGVPDIVLTDNMKTVVDGHEAGKTLFNPSFAAFCNDMGFIPKTCKIRRPQTKGKVERLVRYVKDNFFPGRMFTDLMDLNQQARKWCVTVDQKIHGTTGKIPLQELEQETLQALPSQEIRDQYRWEHRQISKDGFISFDGVRYGVPWQYSGKQAHVRLLHHTVQIYVDHLPVATFAQQTGRNRYVLAPSQYKGLKEQHGIAMTPPRGRLTANDVATRPLAMYDKIMEGIANA